MSEDKLADALTALADAYAREPLKIIGQYISVSDTGAAPGSKIIGSKIEVQSTGRASIIGQQVTVSSNDGANVQAEKDELVRQLREASELIKAGKSAPKSWVAGLLKQIPEYASAGVKALVTAAVTAAATHYM